ncbi:hypothetical protein SHKM778_18840 [Streptomyces sp. KM77-8]|uniref:Uncharacterized protein n=1 Tax=Streptomyces haneummycinicus TaxID=3074435 RepID=A0AAT9HDM8_9ACTN
MRSYVEDYVSRSGGRLHPQIVGQFRQTVATEFGTRVRGMDRPGMLALLAHHGIRRVPVAEALDPADLARRYVDARMAARPADPAMSPEDARAVLEADAENLSPLQMFDHLERNDLLPAPGDLDDTALARLLGTAYTQSTSPLDDTESARLMDAVVNWEHRWGTPEGEIFLLLLAHAFELRVDVVRSFPEGTRRVSGAGPDTATRQTEVYYNGVNHYDGSDAGARDRFGDPVLPKRIKDEERDRSGDVRLNPLWVPLEEVDPDLLITGNRDAVWLYTVTDDGQVILGTEALSGIITPEQFDALLAGMREKDPDLTARSLREALDGLGHTGIAAGFVAGGEADAGRTLPGRSRVSGEFRWSAERGSWVVNDKSGRYMSETVRPGLDAAEAAGWLTNVAALFSARLGVVVRTDQVKTAPPAPKDPAPKDSPPADPPPPSAPTTTPSGDDTGKLDTARRVGTVLRGLGHPVVLAGAARGRVQFGQSRPLGAVEFQLPALPPSPRSAPRCPELRCASGPARAAAGSSTCRWTASTSPSRRSTARPPARSPSTASPCRPPPTPSPTPPSPWPPAPNPTCAAATSSTCCGPCTPTAARVRSRRSSHTRTSTTTARTALSPYGSANCSTPPPSTPKPWPAMSGPGAHSASPARKSIHCEPS